MAEAAEIQTEDGGQQQQQQQQDETKQRSRLKFWKRNKKSAGKKERPKDASKIGCGGLFRKKKNQQQDDDEPGLKPVAKVSGTVKAEHVTIRLDQENLPDNSTDAEVAQSNFIKNTEQQQQQQANEEDSASDQQQQPSSSEQLDVLRQLDELELELPRDDEEGELGTEDRGKGDAEVVDTVGLIAVKDEGGDDEAQYNDELDEAKGTSKLDVDENSAIDKLDLQVDEISEKGKESNDEDDQTQVQDLADQLNALADSQLLAHQKEEASNQTRDDNAQEEEKKERNGEEGDGINAVDPQVNATAQIQSKKDEGDGMGEAVEKVESALEEENKFKVENVELEEEAEQRREDAALNEEAEQEAARYNREVEDTLTEKVNNQDEGENKVHPDANQVTEEKISQNKGREEQEEVIRNQETERAETQDQETARLEPQDQETERAEPEHQETERAEPEHQETERAEPQDQETERAEPQKQETERAETQDQETARLEPEHQETEKTEPQDQETERAEPQDQETERAEPQDQEAERAEPQDQETERAEPQDQETERAETQDQETERAESQDQETQRAETQDQETERAEPQDQETERAEPQDQETQRAETQDQETERTEPQDREEGFDGQKVEQGLKEEVQEEAGLELADTEESKKKDELELGDSESARQLENLMSEERHDEGVRENDSGAAQSVAADGGLQSAQVDKEGIQPENDDAREENYLEIKDVKHDGELEEKNTEISKSDNESEKKLTEAKVIYDDEEGENKVSESLAEDGNKESDPSHISVEGESHVVADDGADADKKLSDKMEEMTENAEDAKNEEQIDGNAKQSEVTTERRDNSGQAEVGVDAEKDNFLKDENQQEAGEADTDRSKQTLKQDAASREAAAAAAAGDSKIVSQQGDQQEPGQKDQNRIEADGDAAMQEEKVKLQKEKPKSTTTKRNAVKLPGVKIETGPSTMMWNSIVRNSMVGTGVFTRAAACSLDTGGVYSRRPNEFTPTVEQVSSLSENFSNREVFSAAGFGVADLLFDLQEETGTTTVLSGASGERQEGVLVTKSKTAMLIGVYTSKLDAALDLINELRDHMTSQGL